MSAQRWATYFQQLSPFTGECSALLESLNIVFMFFKLKSMQLTRNCKFPSIPEHAGEFRGREVPVTRHGTAGTERVPFLVTECRAGRPRVATRPADAIFEGHAAVDGNEDAEEEAAEKY